MWEGGGAAILSKMKIAEVFYSVSKVTDLFYPSKSGLVWN